LSHLTPVTALHLTATSRKEAKAMNPKRLRAIALLTVVLMLSATVPAYASPAAIADKQKQALAVKAQVDALDVKMEVASEAYDQASGRYQQLNTKVKNTQAHLAALTAHQDQLQGSLDIRADGMYRTGPSEMISVLLGARSFDDFASTWDMLNQVNKQDAATVQDLKDTRVQVKSTEDSLLASQAAAKVQLKTMADNKAQINAQLVERKNALVGVQAEVAALQAADEAKALAAARALVSRRGGGGGGGGGNFPTPTIPAHGDVVDYARSRLGCPYRWGAAGPSEFDCSGLAMWCYAKVGISLPHFSGAQINVGQRVSLADLQPGDLVFFGSPIHHVGIYIGGGMMIHAPHTGTVVKISPLESGFAGACRP
jgi:cell wall-associated NlpC family hydrolase